MASKNSGKTVNLPRGKSFVKGKTGNPNGRPKGQRNYATIYREALIKLAALNDITPEAIEDDMIKMAVTKARKGDPIFYKDVMDRIHGKPMQPIGGSKDNPLEISFFNEEQLNTIFRRRSAGGDTSITH